MIGNTSNSFLNNDDDVSLEYLNKKTISFGKIPSNKMCKAPLPMKKTRCIDSFETNVNDFNRYINNTSLQTRIVNECIEEMKECCEPNGSILYTVVDIENIRSKDNLKFEYFKHIESYITENNLFGEDIEFDVTIKHTARIMFPNDNINRACNKIRGSTSTYARNNTTLEKTNIKKPNSFLFWNDENTKLNMLCLTH